MSYSALLKRMLIYEPDQRISMKEVFEDEFIQYCREKKYGRLGIVDNYQVIGFLGKGNYGNVLLVKDTESDFYALKEIQYDEKNQTRKFNFANCRVYKIINRKLFSYRNRGVLL